MAPQASGLKPQLSGLKWALALGGLCLLTLACFLPAVPREFVSYDDPGYLELARADAARPLRDVFRVAAPEGPDAELERHEYLPVRDLVAALGWRLWGTADPVADPARARLGFHVLAVLLHALAAVLATLWLAALTGRRRLSLAAGLIFALHPVHAESVLWFAGLKDVLSGAGFFAAALSYLAWRRQEGCVAEALARASASAAALAADEAGRGRTGQLARAVRAEPTPAALDRLLARLYAPGRVALYLLALFFFLAAGLSKATTLVLPLVLLLAELCWPPGAPAGPVALARSAALRRLLPLVPFFLFAGLLAALHAAYAKLVGAIQESPVLSTAEWLSALGVVLRDYLLALLYPFGLALDYNPRYLVEPLVPGRLAVGWLVLLFLGAALVPLVRRRRMLLPFAGGFFLLTLLFVLLPTAVLRADRYLYLPALAGALVLAALLLRLGERLAGLQALRRRSLPAPATAAVTAAPLLLLLVVLAGLTGRAARAWDDSWSLWGTALEREARSSLAEKSLGDLWAVEAQVAERAASQAENLRLLIEERRRAWLFRGRAEPPPPLLESLRRTLGRLRSPAFAKRQAALLDRLAGAEELFRREDLKGQESLAGFVREAAQELERTARRAAEQHLARALALAPPGRTPDAGGTALAGVLYRRAQLELASQQYGAARAGLLRAEKLLRRELGTQRGRRLAAEVDLQLGQIASKRGQPEEAFRRFELALALDPTSHTALAGMAAACANLYPLPLFVRAREYAVRARELAARSTALAPEEALELQARYWNLLGQINENSGELADAREPYAEAVRLDPGTARYQRDLRRVQENLGFEGPGNPAERDEAWRCIRAGQGFQESGLLELALQQYRKAIRHQLSLPLAHYCAGLAALELAGQAQEIGERQHHDRSRQAWEALDQAARTARERLAPAQAELAAAGLSPAREQASRLCLAEIQWRLATSRLPEMSPEDLAACRQTLEELLRLNPELAQVQVLLAWTLLALEQPQAAEAAARRAGELGMALPPRFADRLRGGRAGARAALDEQLDFPAPDAAAPPLASLDQVLQDLQAGESRRHELLLQAQESFNRADQSARKYFEQARDDLKNACSFAPNEKEFRLKLSVAQWQLHDFSDCSQTLEELLKLDPEFAPAHVLLAWTLLVLQRPLEAERHADLAREYGLEISHRFETCLRAGAQGALEAVYEHPYTVPPATGAAGGATGPLPSSLAAASPTTAPAASPTGRAWNPLVSPTTRPFPTSFELRIDDSFLRPSPSPSPARRPPSSAPSPKPKQEHP